MTEQTGLVTLSMAAHGPFISTIDEKNGPACLDGDIRPSGYDAKPIHPPFYGGFERLLKITIFIRWYRQEFSASEKLGFSNTEKYDKISTSKMKKGVDNP